jgi:hypothetical protein
MTKDEALKLALDALEADPAEMVEDENGHMVFRRIQAIITLREALANEALDKMAENARELGLDYEPEQPFITHNVEQPYDWSEWVCPDPKGYLMKCCDCGLAHEAEFAVVRYKSETEREDCDMVDDPNLQAVFRMRRSEEWMPEDTAHRSGGLPMAQPEQEPMTKAGELRAMKTELWKQTEQDGECKHCTDGCPACDAKKLPEQDWIERERAVGYREGHRAALAQRTWVGLTDKDWNRSKHNYDFQKGVDWAESILKEKNA